MKIVINIDLPKTCGDCPFCIFTAEEKRAVGFCNTSNEDYYCKALDRFMEYDIVDGVLDILGKPIDCPLKEIGMSKDWDLCDRIREKLKDIIIVNQNGKYRPVKNTSSQECYRVIYEINLLLKREDEEGGRE